MGCEEQQGVVARMQAWGQHLKFYATEGPCVLWTQLSEPARAEARFVDVLEAISHFWGLFCSKTTFGDTREAPAADVPSTFTEAQLAARGHRFGRGWG